MPIQTGMTSDGSTATQLDDRFTWLPCLVFPGTVDNLTEIWAHQGRAALCFLRFGRATYAQRCPGAVSTNRNLFAASNTLCNPNAPEYWNQSLNLENP